MIFGDMADWACFHNHLPIGNKHWKIFLKPILKHQNYFCHPISVSIFGEHYSLYAYYLGRWL